MYKVIEKFEDLNDNSRLYHVGDIYPREGLRVSKKRFLELAGDENQRGIPLIEEILTKDTPDEDDGED